MSHEHGWRHCPSCGSPWPTDSTACNQCGLEHHRNPPLAVVAVVVDGAGRVLLGLRGEGVAEAGKWSLPGGFVDVGEHPESALAREVAEETGLAVDTAHLVEATLNEADPSKPVVVLAYRVTVEGEPRADDDMDRLGWFAPDALPPLAFDRDRSLVGHSSGGTSHPGPGGS